MDNEPSADEKKQSLHGKVIVSLKHCIIPQEKLSPTPSEIDGLDWEIEAELRTLGCDLIQTSGILLGLPQVAMATGQVLFQRFYYSQSFVRHAMEVAAKACILLASKIEEVPKCVREVINVFHHIRQVRTGRTIQPLVLDQNYINLKNEVVKMERRILKELGFSVHVQHPHKIFIILLEILKVKNQKLMQTAWNYMSDSLRSGVYVLYCPKTIACACIYLSARILQIPLPSKPAWYLLFDVSEEDIHKICLHILSLYSAKKPDPEKLDKIVTDAKQAYQEAKLKAKELASVNSSPDHSSFSPTSSPASSEDNKSLNPDAKKDKLERTSSGIESRTNRDIHHKKRKSSSSIEDGMNSSYEKKSKISQIITSQSPSPRKKCLKTHPRSLKESHRSRSETREKKKLKPKSSHEKKKKKKSHRRSISPNMSRHEHSGGKKAYKSSKSCYASHSTNQEHIHHESRNKEKIESSYCSKDKRH